MKMQFQSGSCKQAFVYLMIMTYSGPCKVDSKWDLEALSIFESHILCLFHTILQDSRNTIKTLTVVSVPTM
jgi:hypothetical protein